MDVKRILRRWFKLRFAIIYPFAVYAIFFTSSDDNSIMAGIWFIVAGLIIRLWANGYAIKLEKLTTSGPYAFVRHPLYLGTMLIAVGFVIMLKTYYIGTAFIVIVAVTYYKTIRREEEQLEGKFKDIYIDYKKKVPAVLPAILPYRKGEKWQFSFKRLMRSKEYKLLFWVIILVIVFYLKNEFVVKHETMNAKIWGLAIVAFILGVSDLAGEVIKKRKSRQASNLCN